MIVVIVRGHLAGNLAAGRPIGFSPLSNSSAPAVAIVGLAGERVGRHDSPTAPHEPIDALLRHNVTLYGDYVTARVAAARL